MLLNLLCLGSQDFSAKDLLFIITTKLLAFVVRARACGSQGFLVPLNVVTTTNAAAGVDSGKPAYCLYICVCTHTSHFSAAGDTKPENIFKFKNAKNSQNLILEEAFNALSLIVMPSRCHSTILRWEVQVSK